MNTDFEQLFKDLEHNVETVAGQYFRDNLSQAKADGQNVLESIKENLERWTSEVESGEMTAEDLEFLVQGEKGLNEMIALKEAGLEAARIDKFRNSLVNTIVQTITSVIKV